MKRTVYIFFCFVSFCLYTHGQSKSIIDDLNTSKPAEGKVVIYQDEAIKNLVGSDLNNSILALPSINTTNQLSDNSTTDPNNNTKTSKGNVIRARGYRIQVFSGNDQKRSKNEAYSRRSAVESAYPNMEVSISYNSPAWRVRAGNFKTREQATQALSEMKARFPGFGKEMHIVDDVIKVNID